MELRTYHLRTWRVSGLNSDMTPKIEDITVKLQGGIKALEKYCKFMTVRGFMKSKPPKIVKVIERKKDGKWIDLKESDIAEAQVIVDQTLKKVESNVKIDYKSEFEGQKKRNDDLEARLKALEGKPEEDKSPEREILEAKATELGIAFRSNIGDPKLLEKINEIEPDFKI